MTEAKDDPLVLTATEAAAILRLSVDTIRDMNRDGRLPRVAGIRPVRIPAAAVYGLARGEYVATSPGRVAPLRGGTSRPPGPDSRRVVPRRVGPSAGDVLVRRVTDPG